MTRFDGIAKLVDDRFRGLMNRCADIGHQHRPAVFCQTTDNALAQSTGGASDEGSF